MTGVTIDHDRLAQITTLSRGWHHSFAEGVCVMEAVALIAHEPQSNAPNCASAVIGEFMRTWNDGLAQKDRDALILPLVPRLVGTRGSEALENRRAALAADWLVRVHAPAWLRLAGLTARADAIANLPEIVDFTNTPRLFGPLEAAQNDAVAARAAWDANWDAGWGTDWDADWDAARVTAWAVARAADRMDTDANWSVAANAAWVTAWAAAKAAAADGAKAKLGPNWAAARADDWAAAKAAVANAMKAKLEPTRLRLQNSVLALVERMISLSDEADSSPILSTSS